MQDEGTEMLAESVQQVADFSQDSPRPSVIQRVTQILDAFTAGPERLLLEDVSAISGLPRSTTFRIMSQLAALGWLEHDSRGYRLGARSQTLGQQVDVHAELRSAAAEPLNQLHLATNAVAHLGVLEGTAVRYLDKVGGAWAHTVPSKVGGVISAHRTMIGRSILAALPPEKVDTLLTAPSFTDRFDINLEDLHTQLNRIRGKRGVAMARGALCNIKLGSVAVPIMGADGPIGALSVSGVDLRVEGIAPMVVGAVRRTTQTLFEGCNPGAARAKSDDDAWSAVG
jgi:DNA-binding IclR family transcriptional regulator